MTIGVQDVHTHYKNLKSKYIYGKHAVEEAIRSGASIEKVFLQKDQNSDLFPLCREHDIPVSKVPAIWFKKFANKNHQGAIALSSPIEFVDAEEEIAGLFESGNIPLVLALDEITDVRNFGAIMRSAEAFGVNLVLIPSRGSAAINADAVKTSAGALFNLKVARTHSLRNSLKSLQMSGLQIVCATEKGAKAHHLVDWTLPTVLVMGSEEKGISEDIIKMADELARIQMIGKTSSLNVSVAAGIFLSEIIQNRQV